MSDFKPRRLRVSKTHPQQARDDASDFDRLAAEMRAKALQRPKPKRPEARGRVRD